MVVAISDAKSADKHLVLPGSVVELDSAQVKPHVLTQSVVHLPGGGLRTLQRISG